jgi:hypothetical protein
VAGGLCLAVVWIYQPALDSHFFNDDFQWLVGTFSFEPSNFLHLDRYDHFYRPVIETYFYTGRRLFGCSPSSFHLASVGVHLVTTLLLSLFAYALTGSHRLALMSGVLFAVQSGPVEAVAWIGAITDLLPAMWYVLTLWAYLRFLQTRHGGYYAASLAAFTTCLLTHESSATLLPVMLALEATLLVQRGQRQTVHELVGRMVKYVPFAGLLAATLVIAYVVNTRSYLVREGHYALGWHAVPHIFQYVVSLYVGKRMAIAYIAIAAAASVVLLRGTPRQRFYVVWMFVALAPASFFTWGNASRYLYLPAAPFALLLADLVETSRTALSRRLPSRAVSVIAVLTVCAVAARFAVFARKAAGDFRKRTVPYQQLIESTRASNPPAPTRVVYVNREDARHVPVLYLEPAIKIAYCTPDLAVAVREPAAATSGVSDGGGRAP